MTDLTKPAAGFYTHPFIQRQAAVTWPYIQDADDLKSLQFSNVHSIPDQNLKLMAYLYIKL